MVMSWPPSASIGQRGVRGRDRDVSEEVQARKFVESAIEKVAERTGIPGRILHTNLSLSSNPEIIFDFPHSKISKPNFETKRGQCLFDLLPYEVTDICLRLHATYHELLFQPRIFGEEPFENSPFCESLYHSPVDTIRPTLEDDSEDNSGSSPRDSLFSRIPSTSSCASWFPYDDFTTSDKSSLIKDTSAIGPGYPFQTSSTGKLTGSNFILVKLEETPLWVEESPDTHQTDDQSSLHNLPIHAPKAPPPPTSTVIHGPFLTLRNTILNLSRISTEESRRIQDLHSTSNLTKEEVEMIPIRRRPVDSIIVPIKRSYEPMIPHPISPPRVPFARERLAPSPAAHARLRVHSDPLYFHRLAVRNRTREWFYNQGGAASTLAMTLTRRRVPEEERVQRKVLAPITIKVTSYGHGVGKTNEVEEDKVLSVCWEGRGQSVLSTERAC